jgi:hypothetical protein
MDPEMGRKLDESIQKILDKAQYKRFKQIELQVSGPMGIARPDIVEALGLTETQMDKIEKVLEANRPQGGPGGPGQGGPGQGGPGGPGGPNVQQQEEVMKKVLAVFTETQRGKYKELCGAPFKLSMPGPGGPGGQGGPRGQGGRGQGGRTQGGRTQGGDGATIPPVQN